MTAPHRRNEQARQAILRAALEICQERGYAALTIEGVAARAGVGKQTIYRWWPSKGTVVLEAFRDALGPALEAPPDDDDTLGGLPKFLHRSAELLSHPRFGPMLADLVGAMQHDAALAAEFQEQIYDPTRAGTIARIRRAQEKGELRPLDPDLVADLFFGPLWFRLLVTRMPPPPAYANDVVEALLAGLRQAPVQR
jgi:AcrR family transcriptional regulator